MLVVFLAEVGAVGLHEIQELQDDRGHAAKVPRPRGALPPLGQRLDGHPGREPGRIHEGRRRREDELNAFGAEVREITGQVPRVALEVFVRSELRRVDEDADDHPLALVAGLTDESEVALVQRAHGGHEAERSGDGRSPGPQGREALDHVHDHPACRDPRRSLIERITRGPVHCTHDLFPPALIPRK